MTWNTTIRVWNTFMYIYAEMSDASLYQCLKSKLKGPRTPTDSVFWNFVTDLSRAGTRYVYSCSFVKSSSTQNSKTTSRTVKPFRHLRSQTQGWILPDESAVKCYYDQDKTTISSPRLLSHWCPIHTESTSNSAKGTGKLSTTFKPQRRMPVLCIRIASSRNSLQTYRFAGTAQGF